MQYVTSELGGLNQPALISGTDGVGTKQLLVIEANMHATIGIDLMQCVPMMCWFRCQTMYFLDYTGLGELEPNKVMTIVKELLKAVGKRLSHWWRNGRNAWYLSSEVTI